MIPGGREKRGRTRAGGRGSDRGGERRGIFVGPGMESALRERERVWASKGHTARETSVDGETRD